MGRAEFTWRHEASSRVAAAGVCRPGKDSWGGRLAAAQLGRARRKGLQYPTARVTMISAASKESELSEQQDGRTFKTENDLFPT